MKEMLYKDICYSFSNYLCVELYRHNLDDPLPPVHSQPVQVPLEGDLDYSYATITGSGHTRNTLETDENYAIPLQPSHGTSEGSATPIPQFPVCIYIYMFTLLIYTVYLYYTMC